MDIPQTSDVPTNPKLSKLARVRQQIAESPAIVALIIFVLLFLYFSFAAPDFLTLLSLTNILTLASINGILVVGVAILMISGHFDLSIGSILAVSAFVWGLAINAGIPPFLGMIIALLISALLGFINGYIVVRTGIPSFIATLGTLLAYRGLARAIGGGNFVRWDGERFFLFDLLNGPITVINRLTTPEANMRVGFFWFLAFVFVAAIVMVRTSYGSWVYATGGNAAAALAQGVKTKQIVVFNFVLSGLLAGFAGILNFAWRPIIDPLRGNGFELIAVAACVIGGVWLTGGYGTLLGAAFGILLLQMVEQGLVLMGVDILVFQASIGVILIVAVIFSTYLSRQ